jgi:hypothetical protein
LVAINNMEFLLPSFFFLEPTKPILVVITEVGQTLGIMQAAFADVHFYQGILKIGMFADVLVEVLPTFHANGFTHLGKGDQKRDPCGLLVLPQVRLRSTGKSEQYEDAKADAVLRRVVPGEQGLVHAA